MQKSDLNLWFPNFSKSDSKKFRLFCFPYAGGSSYFYTKWRDLLPDNIDLCPVQLPGRANRIGEECFSDIEPLVSQLAELIYPLLDMPFAFFGHSMGGLISFELTKLLEDDKVRTNHLFLSSIKAPQISARRPDFHTLPTEEFKKELTYKYFTFKL